MTRSPRRRWAKRVVIAIVALGVLLLVALVTVKVLYGGGEPYPSVATTPSVSADAVSVVIELDRPPACIAVSADGRVFFDLHAFGHPKRFGEDLLFEVVNGEAVPFPSVEAQRDLRAPFGLTVGPRNRLWVVESGGLEGFRTRVLAFELDSGERVVEHLLPEDIGTFAQDLRVTPDGRHIVLADTGLFRFTAPSLLVLDAENGEVIRTFSGHPSLEPQDWVTRRWDGGFHRLAWGLVSFQVGVDGLSISEDGRWLYYATMSHDTLFRLSLEQLVDPDVADRVVAASVEGVGTKPLSDGIEHVGGVTYITDIENSGIATVDAEGRLRTLLRLDGVIWADSVAIAPDGDVLFTDSAIPAYVQPLATPPPEDVLAQHRPYRIYRVELGSRGD
jgi:sugar lactone lactonase YvrE